MKSFNLASIALVLGIASANTTVSPPTTTCSTCYTRTTASTRYCPYFDPATCITPDCIELKTTVIPTKSCDVVVTTPGYCQTACPTGCATSTTTIVDSTDKCVPTSPAGGCFTATTTSGIINCPLETDCGYGGTTTQTYTVTRPGPNPYCAVTNTVTRPPTCVTSCSTSTTITVTASPYGTTY